MTASLVKVYTLFKTEVPLHIMTILILKTFCNLLYDKMYTRSFIFFLYIYVLSMAICVVLPILFSHVVVHTNAKGKVKCIKRIVCLQILRFSYIIKTIALE